MTKPDAPAYPWGPAPVMPRQNETNGLAIGAFIASLIGFSLPALVMGIIALKQCRREHKNGDGFAQAAIWIGALGTIGWSILMIALIIGASAAGSH